MLADSGKPPSVDLVVSATSPLSMQLATEAERHFGVPLLEIYGSSKRDNWRSGEPPRATNGNVSMASALHQDSAGTWAAGTSVEGRVLLNDIIELHGASRFHLHGRTADLVNIAGKRTSLAHLNYHLNAIPGVRDGVFIVPEESNETTTRLMALVVRQH